MRRRGKESRDATGKEGGVGGAAKGGVVGVGHRGMWEEGEESWPKGEDEHEASSDTPRAKGPHHDTSRELIDTHHPMELCSDQAARPLEGRKRMGPTTCRCPSLPSLFHHVAQDRLRTTQSREASGSHISEQSDDKVEVKVLAGSGNA